MVRGPVWHKEFNDKAIRLSPPTPSKGRCSTEVAKVNGGAVWFCSTCGEWHYPTGETSKEQVTFDGKFRVKPPQEVRWSEQQRADKWGCVVCQGAAPGTAIRVETKGNDWVCAECGRFVCVAPVVRRSWLSRLWGWLAGVEKSGQEGEDDPH